MEWTVSFRQSQSESVGNPGKVDEAVDDLTDDSPFEGGLIVSPLRTVLRERGPQERLAVHVTPDAEGMDENGPVGTKKVCLLTGCPKVLAQLSHI